MHVRFLPCSEQPDSLRWPRRVARVACCTSFEIRETGLRQQVSNAKRLVRERSCRSFVVSAQAAALTHAGMRALFVKVAPCLVDLEEVQPYFVSLVALPSMRIPCNASPPIPSYSHRSSAGDVRTTAAWWGIRRGVSVSSIS